MSDTPKFRPGDPAIVRDRDHSRHGRVVWLHERRLGMIAKRPYWMASDAPDGIPNIAITEDILVPDPAAAESATIKLCPSCRGAGVFFDCLSTPVGSRCCPKCKGSGRDSEPIVRYDPREPEAVESKAPPYHDGQAATSNARDQPAPMPEIAADRVLRDIFGRPNTVSVVIGVERWRLADLAHRRTSTQSNGHVVQVWVTVLPDLVTGHVTFCSPYTADEVIARLDASLQRWARPAAFEVTEDTGEIEP